MDQSNPRPRLLAKALPVLALLAVAASLCAGGILYCQSKPVPREGSQYVGQYVALGSSFGAGPGVAERAAGSPRPCLRSTRNYAHLVAEKEKLSLTDMTCSGATAEQVLYGGQHFQGPQIDAVSQNTQLVTITVGGNDVSYLGNLFAWSCRDDPSRIPRLWRAVCHVTPASKVDAELAALPAVLRTIAVRIRRRAPQARIIFVDYTTVLPDTGYCPEKLPISNEEMDRSRTVGAALANITAKAAQETGSSLVKASELTHGHDVCSKDPWVFGYTFPRSPLTFAPVAYHPTESAMRAIAAGIEESLKTPR